VGTKIVTIELLEDKAFLARETFDLAGVWDVVELVVGDARQRAGAYRNIGFCFLDAEKEHYLECYEAVAPNLVDGGLLVADNVISHRPVLEPFIRKVLADPRCDASIVPIGRGELLCRRVRERESREA
jgi:predicted O-methyltransferase YrrM